MNIGVVGASGKSGTLIVEELLARNYSVTGIVRNQYKLKHKDIAIIEKDLFELTNEDLEGIDVLVYAFATWGEDLPIQENAITHVLKCVKDTTIRLIVVGGAGSLYVDKKKSLKLKDTPTFPESIYPVANIGDKVLNQLKESPFSTWTYFSPAESFLFEGKRTEEFFMSDDQLPVNDEGKSQISYADYAVALVDEIEAKQCIGKQCSVGAKKSYKLD